MITPPPASLFIHSFVCSAVVSSSCVFRDVLIDRCYCFISLIRKILISCEMIEHLAAVAGTTSSVIRLVITLFAGYGLAGLYRLQVLNRPLSVQHAYFIITGLALMLFNYGWNTYHSIIGVIMCYIICKFFGGTALSAIMAFTFYMGYLLVGFYFTATDGYDLTWTLPQCILTLRLIAVIVDLYDGRTIKPEKMDAGIKETALFECPTLAEIAATTYFYGSFIVGPQYSLRRFRDFTSGKFEPPTVTEQESWDRVKTSWGRLVLGISYAFAHGVIFVFFPTEYFLTPEFKAQYLIVKFLITVIWLRAIMLRYQAVWLLAEGSCILSGLAYNGRDKHGVVLWDAVRNMRMVKFEFGCSFQSVIDSFNYNTNLWSAKYVFKRLRFLGNKNLSHVLTLLFLSVWHGFHSGYPACFMFEFACVICERQAQMYFTRNKLYQTLARTPEFLFPIWLVEKLIVVFGCGFGFLPFSLLTFDRWIIAYSNMYFLGWIGIFSTLLISKFVWRPKTKLGILPLLI